MRRSLLFLVVATLSACPDFIPVDDARITCAAASDCPSTWSCEPAVARCIPNDKPDRTPPSGTFSVDPTTATTGELVTITVVADEPLDRPALVKVGDDEATLVDVDGGTYEFVVPEGDAEDEGARPVIAELIDLFANVATPQIGSVFFDYSAAVGPNLPLLELREVGAPDADDATNTFTLTGLAGAIPDTHALVFSDSALTQLLADVEVNAGAFGAIDLPAGSEAVFVVSADDAGSRSASVEVAVPKFTDVSANEQPRNGDPFSFTFASDQELRANPTVTVGGTAATFVSRAALVYTYSVDLEGTEPEGVDAAIVRISGASAALGPNNQGSDAVRATLDFTLPTIDPTSIDLQQRGSPDTDLISGLAAAVSDNSASDTLIVEVFDDVDTTPIDTIFANADGGFDQIDVGDNEVPVLRMRVTDAAGNFSEASFDNDVIAPVISEIDPSAANARNGDVLSISTTVDDTVGVALVPVMTIAGRSATNTGGTIGAGTVTFTYSFTVATSDGEGAHPITVHAEDAAGNVDELNNVSVNFDFTNPSVTNVEPGAQPRWNAEPPASGTASDAGSNIQSVQLALQRVTTSQFFDGAVFASASPVFLATSGTTSWSIDLSDAPFVENESYRITVRAIDGAGNVTDIGPQQFVFDRAAPNTTINNAPAGLVSTFTPIDLLCDEAPCTFECSVDGAAFTSCTSPFTLPALDFGAHTFAARATDQGGNLDATPASTSFTLQRVFIEVDAHGGSGSDNACGVAQNGSLWCWGDNSFNQLSFVSSAFFIETPVAIDASTNWANVAVGQFHACATKTGGSLHCFGNGQFNQLGTATPTNGINNIDVGAYSKIAAGSATTCAIDGGDLLCWGSNFSGEAGTTTAPVITPTEVIGGPPSWIDVAMGGSSACGIGSDGLVYCWGSDSFSNAALGLGINAGDRPTPTPLGGISGAIAVSQSGIGGCAVDDEGALFCWGTNGLGQAGDDPLINSVVGTPRRVDGNNDWLDVKRSGAYTCGVRAGGRVICFGGTEFGERGDGVADPFAGSNVARDLGTGFTTIAVGSSNTWLGRSDGTTTCVGRNDHGQCGVGVLGNKLSLVQVATNVIGVGAASRFTHALTTTSSLISTGDNQHRMLGDGTTRRRNSFAAGVAGAFTRVSGGFQSTCALTSIGQISCWGLDNTTFGDPLGMLGAGAGDQSPGPVIAGAAGDRWTDVAVGGGAVCAVLTSGANHLLRCWGRKLEVAAFTVAESPAAVTNDTAIDWLSVDVGNNHACGVRVNVGASGTNAFCWGDEGNGALGNGNFGNSVRRQVTPVTGTIVFDTITTGDNHSCGLSAGTLFCWGADNAGQIGKPAPAAGVFATPQQIGDPGDYLDVAAGGENTCAIRNSGVPGNFPVECWGRSYVGTGAVIDTPQQVGALVDVGTVSVGDRHACFVTLGAANTLSCLGENFLGELGDGDGFFLTPRVIPEP